MMNDEHDSIEKQINQALDNSIESLSPDIQRRLNQIRIEATENKTRYSSFLKMAGAASFVFAAFLGWQLLPMQTQAPESIFVDLLQEDIEMLGELEFVYWMAEEEDSISGNSKSNQFESENRATL